MNVEDIAIQDFVVFPDNGSLRQAAGLMREKEADVLLVRQGERTVGTLSHRDLALKGYAEGRDPDKDPVAMVECSVCKKSIPPSQAISQEAHDYVLYFCGGQCRAEWERGQAQKLEKEFEERSGVKRR